MYRRRGRYLRRDPNQGSLLGHPVELTAREMQNYKELLEKNGYTVTEFGKAWEIPVEVTGLSFGSNGEFISLSDMEYAESSEYVALAADHSIAWIQPTSTGLVVRMRRNATSSVMSVTVPAGAYYAQGEERLYVKLWARGAQFTGQGADVLFVYDDQSQDDVSGRIVLNPAVWALGI